MSHSPRSASTAPPPSAAPAGRSRGRAAAAGRRSRSRQKLAHCPGRHTRRCRSQGCRRRCRHRGPVRGWGTRTAAWASRWPAAYRPRPLLRAQSCPCSTQPPPSTAQQQMHCTGPRTGRCTAPCWRQTRSRGDTVTTCTARPRPATSRCMAGGPGRPGGRGSHTASLVSRRNRVRREERHNACRQRHSTSGAPPTRAPPTRLLYPSPRPRG